MIPAIPDSGPFLLAGARLLAGHCPFRGEPVDRDGFVLVDLLIDGERFAAVAPAGTAAHPDVRRVDLAGRIALETFVDAHTHLDKAHIWRRTHNPTGDFWGALDAVTRDREAHWTAQDVAARMDFCLRTAYAHGSAAIRTHIDSVGPQTRISWPVLAEARERWKGRIALQAAPLFKIESALDAAHMGHVEAMLDAYGTGVLGAVTYMVPELGDGLAVLFALAERKGWDLDFHVDESADPEARSLRVIADMALARRFPGRILAGHCCSLSVQDEDEHKRAIEAAARANVSVVSLPMCNLFLQDRHAGRTPRWRGVTALHELSDAGVEVMIASDNVRDPFYAYGDLDMLEVWREGVRILHLDYPFARWAPVVREAPARAMGLALDGVRAGAPADLVLTDARDFTQLFARPHADRIVLRAGKRAPPPPDYAELEALGTVP
ncbi:cytosine deaminase [Roseiarcus fermentans]|uniref:Cytosine deaminase n=1 Tax=Roseiarcus fermentans TaxID=1473586 RepID=A0A366FC24_9HYPH|nr:cytosine deaminase [Roseiarcus fermentans]RBP12223.1 cytosine deaminase [Roseiarcus fermentans]